jgi:hypothetical protein
MAANVAYPVAAAPSVESALLIDRYHVADFELYDRARIYTAAAVHGFNLFGDGNEEKEANTQNR